MLNFDEKVSEGFLSANYEFMNIKNPFYPTHEMWMQLDSQQINYMTHDLKLNDATSSKKASQTIDDQTYSEDKKREKEVPILEILQDIMSSRRNSSKCELKNRSDVVNKSILRAIKRHLAKAFKSYHPYRRFKVLRNKLNHFEKSLREMSDVYMHQYQANDVYNIFGYLINPEIFSQTLNYEKSSYPEIKEFAEVFQDCCIHYSHTKYEYVKQ